MGQLSKSSSPQSSEIREVIIELGISGFYRIRARDRERGDVAGCIIGEDDHTGCYSNAGGVQHFLCRRQLSQ
jgi:hypothetical protein